MVFSPKKIGVSEHYEAAQTLDCEARRGITTLIKKPAKNPGPQKGSDEKRRRLPNGKRLL
jgi:hypothetical protein